MKFYQYTFGIDDFTNKEYPFLRNPDVLVLDNNGCQVDETLIDLPARFDTNDQYGKVTKNLILTIDLTQTIDDIGIYNDEEYIDFSATTIGIENPYVRDRNLNIDSYVDNFLIEITGYTENKLDVVRTYSEINPFIVGLNMAELPSEQYNGVLEVNNDYVKYVIGGDVDTLGFYVTGTGVMYTTFFEPQYFIDPITQSPVFTNFTTFTAYSYGRTTYLNSLGNIEKDEELFGITEPLRIEGGYEVDRGTVDIYARHIALAEVNTMQQLVEYGNGFYTINQ